MPKAAVSAPPPGSRVSEKTITTTEKPPITVTSQPAGADDDAPFQPWTKEIFEYVASLSAADWKDHSVRVYRYPNGEKKPRELGRYLVRFDAENPLVDEAQLTKVYGGGQYDFLVHRKSRLIFRDSFDIEGPSRNPDAAALSGAGASSSELASTLNTVLQHLKTIQTPADQAPKLQETITMISTLAAAIPKGGGVTELVTALKALDELRTPATPKNDLKDTLELLRDLGILGDVAAPTKTMVEQMKDVLEIADMMRGGGAKRDWAMTLVESVPTILEKGAGLLDRAATISANNARAAEARRSAGLPPLPVTPPAPAASAPAPAAGEPRTVAPLETEAAAEPAPAAASPSIVAPSFDWVKGRATQLFFEGKTGDVVAEFLDNISPELGNQLASLTREQLEQFISSDPILGQIAQAPRYKAFVDEIVDFFTTEPLTPAKAN